MPGPLDGFVVVEACQPMAGPFAGMLLADVGVPTPERRSPTSACAG